MIRNHFGLGGLPSANGLSRRGFLRTATVANGGLLVSVSLPPRRGAAESADTNKFAPGAFIRIGNDGRIVLTMPYIEIVQGTYTAIPMLIAAELEVNLTQVRLEHAPPNKKLHGNPLLAGEQATGGSTAMRAAWMPMRKAGATARTMIAAAAAMRWNVKPAACIARKCRVIHICRDAALLTVESPLTTSSPVRRHRAEWMSQVRQPLFPQSVAPSSRRLESGCTKCRSTRTR